MDAKPTQNRWFGLVLPAILCTALWGSAAPCIKLGYAIFGIAREDSFSQLVFAGWRFTLAGLLTLLIAALLRRGPLLPNRGNIKAILSISLFQSMIQYICYYIGLARTTGTNGALLSGTQTFFAILFAHLLLKDDKLTRAKALGCLVGFSGVIVLNLGGALGGFTLLGDGLVLLSAASAGMGALVSRVMTPGHDPVILTAWQLIFGGLLLLELGYAGGGTPGAFTPAGALLLLYMVALSSAAFTVWTALLARWPVGKVTIFGFLIPVFGAFFSALLLDEQLLSVRNLAALALVSAGVILANRSGSNAPG